MRSLRSVPNRSSSSSVPSIRFKVEPFVSPLVTPLVELFDDALPFDELLADGVDMVTGVLLFPEPLEPEPLEPEPLEPEPLELGLLDPELIDPDGVDTEKLDELDGPLFDDEFDDEDCWLDDATTGVELGVVGLVELAGLDEDVSIVKGEGLLEELPIEPALPLALPLLEPPPEPFEALVIGVPLEPVPPESVPLEPPEGVEELEELDCPGVDTDTVPDVPSELDDIEEKD
jgi:hypothetical protein